MIRRSTLIWLTLAALLGFGLYQIKYEVQSQEERFTRINKQIVENQEAIQVLTAEWSFLNRPDRLAEMARRYLEMSPVVPAQFAQIANLPDREAMAAAAVLAASAPAAKPIPARAAMAANSATVPAAKTQLAPQPRPLVSAAPVSGPERMQATQPKPPASPPAANPSRPIEAARYLPPPKAEPAHERASLVDAPSVLIASVLTVLSEASSAPAQMIQMMRTSEVR
ncbi:MAG: hypothetical protein HYR63_16645 [Proteobacteria bacterium]|nr:hypothetical protein [Pseudomonadota bacterium]MBI3496587.1 hypothetical protein [Pseudomonadota bacterium]